MLAAVAARHDVARGSGGGVDVFLLGSLAFQGFFLWSVAAAVREWFGVRFSGVWEFVRVRVGGVFGRRGGGSGEPRPRTRRGGVRESWKVGTIHVQG